MRFLLWLLTIVVLLGIFLFAVVPGQVESNMNGVLNKPPYTPSERAKAIQKKIEIVDLHGDTLLWARDLLKRGSRGHVDVPRLIEANVALQAFSAVTKTPRGINFERNTDQTDNILLLSLAERWPPRTWTSLTQRALYLASRLHQAAARSNGKLTVIRTPADLAGYRERRHSQPEITAGLLTIEGAQALEGKVENVDVLYDAGFRMMSPSHFFDTEMGGSSAGADKIGLTGKGREMVQRMEARHMLVDLAHASPRTIDDVLSIATRPVVASHTGVKGTCDNVRNLSDDHVRRIAATGGMIGIAFFEFAVCGTDAKAIARAIRHASDVAGVDHVGLGSDFDGAVIEPWDVTGLGLLIDALLEAGFSEEDIAKIMGGNAMKLLASAL
ncbi:MAG TPA: dipeptidase [Bryobacteraceae bacterium]|nr:dipeptidase [Bryobacteraceae bacterium]